MRTDDRTALLASTAISAVPASLHVLDRPQVSDICKSYIAVM